VETGIEAGRVETVAGVRRGRGEFDLDAVFPRATGAREPPERRPELEPEGARRSVERFACDPFVRRGRGDASGRRRSGLVDDPSARMRGVRRIGEAWAAQDLDRRRRGLDPAEDLTRGFGREGERLQDFEIP
jgi:hypothetical protein